MEKIVEAHIRQFEDPQQRIGVTYVSGQGAYVRLWAPKIEAVTIEWLGSEPAPLTKEGEYFIGSFPGTVPGDRYWFHLDGKDRIADPASRYQPEGTDGPSELVAADYDWQVPDWKGTPFAEWVIYEIHPGTYSKAGDFSGIVADLPRLRDLGITAIEIMPVSQFSGNRNWGYDGVFPHSVQNSYGGPEGFKRLIDACHAHGIAILLDVVYNHIGPENNMLFRCGPYVRDKYHTPWGDALNFDGAGSDNVRRYFLQSAWQWLIEYRLDGLRLDAVQMIFDGSPLPFLEELGRLRDKAEERRGMKLVLTAESDMNDSRLVAPPIENGAGMDAVWSDDLHHCLHVLLTGESSGYYSDYGSLEQLAKIYRRGVAFEGEYSPYRKRRHGRSFENVDPRALIVETQNHDQIGNRLQGERLITLAGFEKAKLGAACVLLSPFTPFLFMGEEFAAEQPFNYFISHIDPDLVEAVRKGRAEEWQDFKWEGDLPDPFGEAVFEGSRLEDFEPKEGSQAAAMVACYARMIALSKRIRRCGRPEVMLDEQARRIELVYREDAKTLRVLLNFNETAQMFLPVTAQGGQWRLIADTSRFKSGQAQNGVAPNGVAPMGEQSDIGGTIGLEPFSAVVLESR